MSALDNAGECRRDRECVGDAIKTRLLRGGVGASPGFPAGGSCHSIAEIGTTAQAAQTDV